MSEDFLGGLFCGAFGTLALIGLIVGRTVAGSRPIASTKPPAPRPSSATASARPGTGSPSGGGAN